LSIILLELVPWGSSPYMINIKLDIPKIALTCFFTLAWVHRFQTLCLPFSLT
jgi:hypothetical protein